MGSGFCLPAAQALYGPLLQRQPCQGVTRQTDLAYGPHPRQRLDAYAPEDVSAPLPVVVFLHGGGFVRGDKQDRANIGWYLARHGLMAVLPNYRLAPESRWPSGPEDVAAVVAWLADQAAALGGDARRLVLVGESAGAAHVAAAVLMRRFGVDAQAGVRAAALLSGPYDARLERLARPAFGVPTPDPRNDAYFGTDDHAALAACSIIDQVDAAPLPLLISFAQCDLLAMQIQAGALFARLVGQHGFAPELLRVPAHNHFSQTLAVNTGDETLSGPLRAFIGRHV